MDEDAIEYLIEGADSDGDGDINYVAYVNLVCKKLLKMDSAPLKSAFETIDKDNDGTLSIDEVAEVTGQSRTTLEEQLAKVDLDHSGTISFVEFLFGIYKSRGESYIRDGTILNVV